MSHILCTDVFYDVCKFLTRKQQSKLDECTRDLHQFITESEHSPIVLHKVRQQFIISLPHSLKMEDNNQQKKQQQKKNTAAAKNVNNKKKENNIGHYDIMGFFKLTQLIGDKNDKRSLIIGSEHPDDIPPNFVRCRMVFIKNMDDAKIMHFLKRAKHIFQFEDDNHVYIDADVKTPLHHWASIFDWIHRTYYVTIDFKIPTGSEAEIKKRNNALESLHRTLRRRNAKIPNSNRQQFEKECHRLLDDYINFIWPSVPIDCCTNSEAALTDDDNKREQHFNLLGKIVSKWFLCRCGNDGINKKTIAIWDETHLMVPMVRQLLNEMHMEIEHSTTPLNRHLTIRFCSSPFLKDLTQGSSLQFVDNQALVKNLHTGEALQAAAVEAHFDLYGELTVWHYKMEKE